MVHRQVPDYLFDLIPPTIQNMSGRCLRNSQNIVNRAQDIHDFRFFIIHVKRIVFLAPNFWQNVES